jgi:hypothetical protein|tara:strand:+ start:260 stop:424 length:165 start_codon:yes stop_codon:yes gene_type:complete
MTLSEKLAAYECGKMTEEETIVLFQEMLDTGVVWDLQGHYGRTAGYLLDLGVIK